MNKFDIKNIERLDNPKRRKEMPPVDARLSEEEMLNILKSLGFLLIDKIDINNKHYGLKFKINN